MKFSLTGRGGRDTQGPGDQGMIAEVRAYWEALRDSSALPRRDRIDPRGIAGALEHAFMVERIGPGLARFRIAGMALNDLMGMEVRGMPLSALFDVSARGRLQPELEAGFMTPAILDLRLEAERGIGRPDLSARMILLPVEGGRGEQRLALGCLALTGTPGRAPRRFAIARLSVEPLDNSATPARIAAPQAQPGLAETARVFLPAPPPRGKPVLRLVKSGE